MFVLQVDFEKNMSEDDYESILLVSHAFPPDVGGAQNVAVQNARALSQSYDLEVLTGTPAASGWDDQYNFEVTRLNISFGLWPLWYAVAFTQRRKKSYKAVILNDPASIYAAGLSAPQSILRRSIAYLHGSEPEFFFLSPKFLYRLIRFRHYFVKGLNRCQVVVPVSKYMKRKFIEQTGLDHLQSKMQVSYAGVDHAVFYPDPFEFRQSYGIEESSEVLLSASRIVKGKGYDEMLSIFKKLHEEDRAFHWVIAGDGHYREALTNKVKRAGLSNVVTFLGEIPQEELRQYYSSVDVFWLLSRFQEAFGLAYIEANACGVPVIGRNHGGIPESIKDKETGFVVDEPEECIDILRSRCYNQLSAKEIRDHANNFSLSRVIKKLHSIIEGV